MSEFAQNLPVATTEPLCQPWKGRSSAVAAVEAFTSYTLLLGTCLRVTIPSPDKFLKAKVSLESQWVPVVAYWEELMPRWWEWTHRQVAWNSAGHMDWGHIKMKPVDPTRWIAGVHQVVFWCGTSQTGYGVLRRKREKFAKGKQGKWQGKLQGPGGKRKQKQGASS
jgi:hypothetical protein